MTMGCEWAGIGPVPEVIEVLEASTSGFAVNEIVTLSGGYATIAADDGVFGVALKAGSATSTDADRITIPIQVITPDTIWIMQADATTAVTYVGENYGINWTTGSQAVDIGDTTTSQVRIMNLDSRDGATTGAGGRVHVCFSMDVIKDRAGN